MTTLKLGTQETREALDFLFDLTDAIIKSLEDGKVNLLDAPKFLKPFKSASSGISGINIIPKEIVDMDDDEWEEIAAHVAERFDLKDDNIEKDIELILKRAGQLAISIKNLYDKEKAG
jgi:hypothetical protein